MSRTEPSDLAERGRRVLALEAEAIRRVAERLGAAFSAAVRLLATAKGRLIVSGVGKSGLIARKIAATLTSTGSPASFLHPVDSLHGDLGLVGRGDVADVRPARAGPARAPDRPRRWGVVLLAEKRGTVAVVDSAGALVGVVTAGDLTRLMERTDQFLDIPVRDVMTRTPKSTTPDELA